MAAGMHLSSIANVEFQMPYTLRLEGVVVGETDFEHKGQRPRQQAGVFRPAPSGMAALPQITGMFAASLAFTRVVERNRTSSQANAIELLEKTPEGQRLVEHAKVIERLELLDPNGNALAIESIAVSNLQELAELAASKLGKATLGVTAPKYLISATIRASGPDALPKLTLPELGYGRLGGRTAVH